MVDLSPILGVPADAAGAILGLNKKKKKDITPPEIPPPVLPPSAPAPTPKGPQIIRDQDTGEIIGVVTSLGKTFLGVGKNNTQALIKKDVARITIPTGAVEATSVPTASEQAAREQAAQMVGQVPSPQSQAFTPDQQTAIQAGIGQGIKEMVIGAGGGAATGAAAGLIGGPAAPVSVPAAAGAGAIAGGLAGLVHGFLSGYSAKLKEETNQNIQAKYSDLRTSQTNMRRLIIDAKTDPQGALDAFNNQLSSIGQAYSDTYLTSKTDLSKGFGVDAQVELARFAKFYEPGGMRDILVARMQGVLLNPNTPVNDLITETDYMDAASSN